MIIENIPDIVLQATQAADPDKRTQAINKLRAAAEAATPAQVSNVEPQSWPEAIVQVADELALPKDGTGLHGPAQVQVAVSGPIERKSVASNAAMKFEAFVLQTFIETMLPKDSDSVFGTGTSGDIWRSMLAEHIANEAARTGGIGIAQVIDKDAV